MISKKVTSRWLLISVFLVTVIGFLIVRAQDVGVAQTSAISADIAVNQALIYAKDDGLFGGFVTQPSKIQGQLMTFAQARQLILGKSIDANEEIAKLRDYPVWLIVFEGKFVEHVPAAPDIPAKDVMHSQMAIIIDANTAETMEKYLISPQQRLSTTALQVLSLSSGTLSPVPTKAPISTTIPLPTLGP